MDSMLLTFIRGEIAPTGHCVWVCRQRPPDIAEEPILVVHGFDSWQMGPLQEHGEAAGEWFHIVLHIPEALPDKGGGA